MMMRAGRMIQKVQSRMTVEELELGMMIEELELGMMIEEQSMSYWRLRPELLVAG